MDTLERDDIENARGLLPSERARQTIDLMRTGYRLKRAELRTRYPGESDEQIDARFRSWLEADERS